MSSIFFFEFYVHNNYLRCPTFLHANSNSVWPTLFMSSKFAQI